MRLALIDLDGVVADSSERFASSALAKRSEEERIYAAWYEQHAGRVIALEEGAGFEIGVKKQLENLFWQTAFKPDLVQLDALIDGTLEALEQIANDAEYDYYFLTSRPESMRNATMLWLFDHLAFDSEIRLIMKPDSQKYVKTVIWKSGVVELLVRIFGVDDLLFVDDEQGTQDAIAALDLPCDTIIAGSLQEAAQSVEVL